MQTTAYPSAELTMYGCNITEYKESVRRSFTYRYTGGNMIVASLMSDAQELIAMGDSESARQMLNRAKSILFDIMEGQMSGGPEVQ
jgi:hypothetical protein